MICWFEPVNQIVKFRAVINTKRYKYYIILIKFIIPVKEIRMVDKEQFLVVGLVVLSSFIHALDGVIVKWISNLTAMEMTFWRMTIQTIILVPVCYFRF